MKSEDQELASFKITDDEGFEVEFEVLPPTGVGYRQDEIDAGIAECDANIKPIEERVKELNAEIDRLTNHADGIDYATAVICGLIAGVIDSLYVGAWDFKDAKAKANKDINQQIEAFAKKCGYKDNGKGLKGAVEFLEKKFKLPGDNDWKGNVPGVSAKSHHLDDICHHPTLIGLVANIIRQYTEVATYHTGSGDTVSLPIDVKTDGELELVGKNPSAKLFCGIVNWFFKCCTSEKIQQIKLNAEGHWMSDLAGSKQSAGGGSGLPGSFMSLLKELSTLPIFNSKDKNGNQVNAFATALKKAFTNGIGPNAEGSNSKLDLGVFNALFDDGKGGAKFDYRTEAAVKGLLKKQAVPVLVNEALVRGSYFIRRLIREFREKDSIADIEWRKVLPFRNRTIARMMTIATGTFTACDLADATIRSGVSNGFNVYNPKFWSDIVLRVNFVGVGRFAVAVVTDVGMGIKRNAKVGQLIGANAELQLWKDAKILYKQGDMWQAAVLTEKGVEEAFVAMSESFDQLARAYQEDRRDLLLIGQSVEKIRSKPGGAELLKNISDRLKYLG